MITFLSDNPVPVAGAIGTFVAALIALLVSFGVHITSDQAAAILAFVAALFGVLTLIATRASVSKTPSSTSAPLQTPPPGTVLVTSAAASAPKPVPAGSVIAGPTPPNP